jgi:hypothetical protein
VDPLLPPPDDPATPVREWTSDAGYVARVSRVLLRQAYWTRRMVVVVAGVLLVVVGLLVLAELDPVAVVSGLVAGLLVVVVLPAWLGWQMRRQFGRAIPAGTRFRAAVTPDALWVDGPLGASSTSWAAYRAVTQREDIVVLQHRHGRMLAALPAALFPGADVDLLRQHIEAATPGAAAAVRAS